MKKVTLLVLIVISVISIDSARAFDLVEVDLAPQLIVWWFHTQNFGLPIEVHTQVYGSPVDQWTICAAGPVVKVPFTQMTLQVPAGVRLDNADPSMPITHWVGKVNFIGNIGPCQVMSINDKAWGRHGNPGLFFYKDIISYKVAGVRLEGFKFGDDPLPAMLGPTLIYEFGSNTFQVFTGINLRNHNERCFKFEYLFKKF